jgi:raffinose/stachyose/melibiose transport system permease protein
VSNVNVSIKGSWQGYLYARPALFLVTAIVYFGIGANVVFSTWDWNGISRNPEVVGFDNYLKLLADPVFWQAVRNTLLFSIIVVFVQMILGLVLALAVRTRVVGRNLLRTVIFIPVVLSGAVVATSFRQLLAPDGAVNELLEWMGVISEPVAWLSNPSTALFVLAVVNIWQFTGYSFVIYDAAIGQIDPHLIEAATVDGATTVQLTRYVISPLLAGTHLILIVLGFIGGFKTFELVFLTTGGGPGTSTEFLSTYIYRQGITQFHAGYGAALSIALAVVALVFAVLQIRLTQGGAKQR